MVAINTPLSRTSGYTADSSKCAGYAAHPSLNRSSTILPLANISCALMASLTNNSMVDVTTSVEPTRVIIPMMDDLGGTMEDDGWDDMSPSMRHFQSFVNQMHQYVLPIMILIGLAGNTTSFTVFVCTHLRRTSCNIYLAALALSDSAFLLCVFLSWGADIYHQNGWCQTLVYLTHITSFLSVWYVVAFTVERFIIVCFPNYRSIICRQKVAQNTVIAMAVFAFAVYLFSPFLSGVMTYEQESLCAPLVMFHSASWVINNIDTFMTLIVPTIIILGCNMRIAYLVCIFYKSRDNRAALQIIKWDFTSDNKSCVSIHPVGTNKAKSNYQMRATQMLLIVSTVFLICNMPSHVVRTYATIKAVIDKAYRPTGAYLVWQRFFQIIYYINFSVNVFLYSFTSRSFRLGSRRLAVKLGKRIEYCVVVRKLATKMGGSTANAPNYRCNGALNASSV